MNLLFSFLITQGGGTSEKVAEVATKAAEAATEASSSSGSGMGIWGMAAYIVFFIAIFYLFIIRPQRKKDKQIKDMQSGIQNGDEVMTSGGFFGKVVDVNDDVAIVEFGTNKTIRIPVKKSELYGSKAKTAAQDTKTEK